MEQSPQDNKPNELPEPQLERPVLRIDLSGSENNPITLIAATQELLASDEREAFRQEIHEANTPEANKNHEDLLEIIDRHVELVDVSDVYPQYAWKGRITAAVQWLNEQIETLPESVPSNLYNLYPDFDDQAIGPNAYLHVLWSEVAQTEQLISESSDSQRQYLEYYRDLLMTAITKFFRYGLL